MRRLKALALVLALSLITLFAFQNCKAPSEQKNNESGNGSGYGGKLPAGDYYSVDANESCVNSSGVTTSTKGILSVEDDGSSKFYDGCKKENGTQANLDDYEISPSNDKIVSNQSVGMNFERMPSAPMDASRALELVCYYQTHTAASGASNVLFSQSVVRANQASGAEAEYFYTILGYSRGIPEQQNKSIGPFLTTKSVTPSGERWSRPSNPFFQLDISAISGLPNFVPIFNGVLQISIPEGNLNATAEICVRGF